jgi:hypothetical protein
MITEAVKLPNEPILILHFTLPSDPPAEAQQMKHHISKTIPSMDGTLYVVSDLRDIAISFTDVVVGMAEFTQVIHTFQDTIHLIPVLVGTSDMVQMLSASAKQEQYGNQRLPVFETQDDALAYIRSN